MSTTRRDIPLPQCSHIPAPYHGPGRDEVLTLRRKHVAPSVFTYYDHPIQIVEGFKQYLWDDKGRRYLDAIAGIVSVPVGHSHPRIVKAVHDQIDKLIHATTIYLHPHLATYAKNLADHFPEGSNLSVTSFTNSGSEANEVATMLARLHTGHFEVISLRNGYHGGTQATMSLTAMGN